MGSWPRGVPRAPMKVVSIVTDPSPALRAIDVDASVSAALTPDTHAAPLSISRHPAQDRQDASNHFSDCESSSSWWAHIAPEDANASRIFGDMRVRQLTLISEIETLVANARSHLSTVPTVMTTLPAGGSEPGGADEEADEGEGKSTPFTQTDQDDCSHESLTSSEVPLRSIPAAVPSMPAGFCDAKLGLDTSTSNTRSESDEASDADADADADARYVTDVQVRALLIEENAVLQIETEMITVELDDENADTSLWHRGAVSTACQLGSTTNGRSTSPASAALARAPPPSTAMAALATAAESVVANGTEEQLLIEENALLQIETEMITLSSDDENAEVTPGHPGAVQARMLSLEV